ncbi:MAG: sulfatase [Acidobacteria bacterium]|nr:sulfatase [Acidobacteriota bacterium]
MDRRDFLKSSLLASPAALAQQQGGRPADLPDTNGQPNVIWFFGDQHRAQAMSCAGDPNVNTPNLDNLSAQGVHFTQCVSGMPLCCPFRGSLLTGRYAHHCVPGHEYPLPDGQPTIASPFKEAGYHTAYFGKWHLGGFHEREGRAAMYIIPPEKRGGFDTWVGYENNNSQYDCWVHGGQGKDAFHRRLPGYETDCLTDLLIDHIRKQAQARKAGNHKPFFAALSVQPPHNPYVAPDKWLQRHNGATLQLRPNVANVAHIMETARLDLAGYYSMIENLDWNLGRVRQALDETGMTFNTHIVFFSDHGDMHGSHGQFKKMTAYEESIRVPFIIGGESPQGYGGRGNGQVPVPLNTVDIAPTTLGLCGIQKPAWMEGTDYSHYRIRKNRTNAKEPDSAYIQSVVPTGHGDSVDKPWRGVVTRDGWKYVCFDGVSWLMFNLNEDPYEQANLAHNAKYRAQRKRLIERLGQWVKDTGDKFRLPEA